MPLLFVVYEQKPQTNHRKKMTLQDMQGNHWWRGAVIYQIYPRSFFDTTGSGTGDLRGIMEKMDYIASLGVDAIWLTPFMKSPMKDFGYDVSDFREVDPLFGKQKDLDDLITTAHSRGIKVIMDIVINHTSDQHPWFLQSRQSRSNEKADWYLWSSAKEDGTPPNNWLSRFGGPAWTFEPRREQYYYHGFLAEQPDLNYNNPEVQNAVLEELKYWLDKGIDGFRLDACNHFFQDRQLRDNPPSPRTKDKHIAEPYAMQSHVYDRTRPENIEFLKRIRSLIDRYPERFAVAEVGDDNGIETSASYVEAPGLLHTAYCFSMLDDTIYEPRVFRVPVEKFNSLAPHGWPSWSVSNHDAIRPVTRWGGKNAHERTLAYQIQALLFSLRGTLFLYQGQELGLPEAKIPFEKMQDPFGKKLYPIGEGRDGSRTPMPWTSTAGHAGFSEGEPWLPIPEEHLKLSVEKQEEDGDSVLSFTKRFLAWRREHACMKEGWIHFIDIKEPFLAFTREMHGEKITFIFNISSKEASLERDMPPCDEIVPQASRPRQTDKELRFPAYGFMITTQK